MERQALLPVVVRQVPLGVGREMVGQLEAVVGRYSPVVAAGLLVRRVRLLFCDDDVVLRMQIVVLLLARLALLR
jgi:hypothetical protein